MVKGNANPGNQSRLPSGLWIVVACLIVQAAFALYGIRMLTELLSAVSDNLDPVALSFAWVKIGGVVGNFFLAFIAVCLIFKSASRLTFYACFAAIWLPTAVVTLVLEVIHFATDAPEIVPMERSSIYSMMDWAQFLLPTSILMLSPAVAQRFGVRNLGTVIQFDQLWNKARGRHA